MTSQERVVLVTDHPWPSVEPEEEILSQVGGRLVLASTGEEDELVELVRDADAVLTCFARVTAPVVRAGERLNVIGRYGIGVDNIAVDEATNRGILVTNTPSYCTDEVAEHALALMLTLARQIEVFDGAVHAGDWTLSAGQPIHRLRGQTLGIVGFGQIGRALAHRARALGLGILAYHSSRDAGSIRASGAEPATLLEVAERSDFISLHVPLREDTRGLIGTEFLRAMKPTAFLINTARGAVVDQPALVQALRDGWIAGAGVDVVVPERLPADDPLLALPNAIITPHVAYYSEESLVDLGTLAAENVAAALDGRRPASVVNPTVLSLPRWQHLADR